MTTLKIIEVYDGRLPIYNVVKEDLECQNCGKQKDKIIKVFDNYEEAEKFCSNFIDNDNSTPCGEEDPCS